MPLESKYIINVATTQPAGEDPRGAKMAQTLQFCEIHPNKHLSRDDLHEFAQNLAMMMSEKYGVWSRVKIVRVDTDTDEFHVAQYEGVI